MTADGAAPPSPGRTAPAAPPSPGRTAPARDGADQDAPPAAAAGAGHRLVALDGLRGLAALVVVACHVLLTDPVYERAYYAGAESGAPVLVQLLGDTPLRALWNGRAAVQVFFVLSGLVLTRAYLDRATTAHEWRRYYVRRLVRLYVPAVAALLLAVAACRVVTVPSSTLCLAWHREPTGPGEVARAALLVRGPADPALALWSLEYEVLFSLVLPLVVLLAAAARGRLWWPAVLCCLAVAGAGAHLPTAASVAAVFALGALLAARHDRLVDRGMRLRPGPGALLAVAAFLAYSSEYVWRSGPLELHLAVQSAACAGVVALFVAWAPARRLGGSRVAQRLGVVSFSLYLVHEPVVVLTASLGPGGLLARTVLTAAGALLVAQVFHTLVEGPAHRLSQRLGRRSEVRA